MKKNIKVIISGGGTGGHIFPAISIANAIRKFIPQAEILFIGAKDRMEMEKVPAAGYQIIGLPVKGFDRKSLFNNILVIKNLVKSLWLARRAIIKFKPDVVVGVGGYASGPTLRIANYLGIPTVIQEQNSYAGITNKLLANSAAAICVAYEYMERFFPADRIILTGNPVREMTRAARDKADAYHFFKLDPHKKTVLVVGGSLGARTLNEGIAKGISLFEMKDIQVIWQTGNAYFKQAQKDVEIAHSKIVYPIDFITRMDLAFQVADLVISRAGAGTISELCILEKSTILVPSPNVAEDHQTKNAMALVEKEAAVLVKDENVSRSLVDTAIRLVLNEVKLKSLRENIGKMAYYNSADRIAQIVIEAARNR